MTNGKVLAVAKQLGFEVLIAVDRNMVHQQRIEDLLALVIEIPNALLILKTGVMSSDLAGFRMREHCRWV